MALTMPPSSEKRRLTRSNLVMSRRCTLRKRGTWAVQTTFRFPIQWGTSKQNTERTGHRLDMHHRRHTTTSDRPYHHKPASHPPFRQTPNQSHSRPDQESSTYRSTWTHLVGAPVCNRQKSPMVSIDNESATGWLNSKPPTHSQTRLFPSTTETSSVSRTNPATTSRTRAEESVPETSQ